MLPDFNRLKVFYHIFLNRSIAVAAKSLNLTQSGVSQHLKKLEEELGTGLFVRLHKQLVPTAEAERLFELVKPFVHGLEREMELLDRSQSTPRGQLKIGAPAGFGQSYFPGIFAEFRRLYPGVSFYLRLADSVRLLELLRSGEVDFALVDVLTIRRWLDQESDIFCEDRIIDEEVVLAVSKDYSESVLKGDFSYENLVRHEFISYQIDGLSLKSWFKHHFKRRPGNLNIVLTVDNVQAVISGVWHHLGMGLIPSHIIYKHIQQGTIIPITTGAPENINCMSLVQLKNRELTYTEKTFQAFLKTEVQKSKSIFSQAIRQST